MRKTKKSALLGALLALVAGGALSLAVTPASATTPCTDGSVVVNGNTASVSNDADSGDHGNWATDKFTRTTDVKVVSCAAHTYQVIVRDSGTFTTLPDGPSPRQGLPLPSTSFTGSFTGATTYSVTSLFVPHNPTISPISGSPDTGDWWKRFFGKSATGSEDAYFSWTYTTTCSSDRKLDERWVDSNSDGDGADKNAGDITGKVTKCVSVTTTTPPPTTTTTPPPPTSAAPTTGASSGGSGGGNSAVTTTVQQVSTVPVGAPETGGGATAGVQDEWLLIVGGALLIAAAFSLLYLRRRPQGQK